MTFYNRLEQATKNSRVCVGLDPVMERIPESLQGSAKPVREFCEKIIEATAPYAAAYKPNLAFFEMLGSKGDEALEAIITAVREHAPDAIVLGDGKRGDIGSTAERYAKALFERWGFDAITVNPYFGSDGIKPFTAFEDKGVFLLALTSNSSARELQFHPDANDPLYIRVSKLAEEEWNGNRNVGLVVGATKGIRIAEVRVASPSLPFLIPGVGAQGGDLAAAVRGSMGKNMPPGLINSSRGIIYASSGEDFAEKAAIEAKKLRDSIQSILSLTD